MHELAICQAVLDEVLAITMLHERRQVGRITLRIGPLSGVEPALVRRAFPIVAAGTRCHYAKLAIDEIAVSVLCRACGGTSRARANRLLCAECGAWRVTLLSGDEMLLDSIELLCMSETECADV